MAWRSEKCRSNALSLKLTTGPDPTSLVVTGAVVTGGRAGRLEIGRLLIRIPGSPSCMSEVSLSKILNQLLLMQCMNVWVLALSSQWPDLGMCNKATIIDKTTIASKIHGTVDYLFNWKLMRHFPYLYLKYRILSFVIQNKYLKSERNQQPVRQKVSFCKTTDKLQLSLGSILYSSPVTTLCLCSG